MTHKLTFETFNKQGKWHWRISRSQQVLAESVVGCEQKRSCVDTLENMCESIRASDTVWAPQKPKTEATLATITRKLQDEWNNFTPVIHQRSISP